MQFHDIEVNGMRERLGGYLKDIPKPWRRRFNDGRRKRQVQVTISKFYGIGKHWHFDLSEEDNPIWNAALKCWHTAWDDRAGRGKHVSGKRSVRPVAVAAARRMAAKHFPGRKLVPAVPGVKWWYASGD